MINSPEIVLDEPGIDMEHGGWGRSFQLLRNDGTLSSTGRIVFAFKGGRDNRKFLAETIFSHDPLCVSFTDPLETAEQAIDFIKDDQAAGTLIRTALE